jgi:AraC family transcriptional regulator of adaptative response/methylated-DNA-[protein]-cysteine methyltransferase
LATSGSTKGRKIMAANSAARAAPAASAASAAPAAPAASADVTLRDPRWAAVLTRDAAADGRFFYAVRSTGVYCRPSCGARTPRPENVSFHATAAEAERAGFHPCKRCRPDQPPLAERQAALITRLCRQIERAEETPSLDDLARAAGMSRFHLHRLFKAATGVTPKAYAAARRGQRLREQLQRGGRITDAIYDAGYRSNGRFYAESNRLLGMKPQDFRDGGAGASIRFALGRCSLGVVLVAASERGICAIYLGDDGETLMRQLQERFPKADLAGSDAAFAALLGQVIAFIETPRRGLDLPLDIRGTAFQQRVWQALRDLPPGATVSYAELARRIGAPSSARAVAQACAANALAVAIPCHRVIRNDGGLAGYRWGVERKRELLQREAED